MIHDPGYGHSAVTVHLFDDFMRRAHDHGQDRDRRQARGRGPYSMNLDDKWARIGQERACKESEPHAISG